MLLLVCLNSAGNMCFRLDSIQAVPFLSFFVCTDGTLKRHPISESVHYRVETRVGCVSRPRLCKRNFEAGRGPRPDPGDRETSPGHRELPIGCLVLKIGIALEEFGRFVAGIVRGVCLAI